MFASAIGNSFVRPSIGKLSSIFQVNVSRKFQWEIVMKGGFHSRVQPWWYVKDLRPRLSGGIYILPYGESNSKVGYPKIHPPPRVDGGSIQISSYSITGGWTKKLKTRDVLSYARSKFKLAWIFLKIWFFESDLICVSENFENCRIVLSIISDFQIPEQNIVNSSGK